MFGKLYTLLWLDFVYKNLHSFEKKDNMFGVCVRDPRIRYKIFIINVYYFYAKPLIHSI